MKEQIEAILRPFKREGYDTGAEFNGKFWEVWIGSHAGGRENGVSLAQDLAEKVRGMTVKAVPPQPLTAPLAAKPTPPQTDYDAIIAGLKAQLAEALAKAPEVIEIPAFLQPPEAEMNFHDEFIAREALDGEERQDTVARLQLQFEKLTNYSYVRALEDAEQARLSELTTNLRLGG
jgi:hypothetical protein